MSHPRYRYGMNWIRQEKRLSIYMRDNFACLYCGTGIEDANIILTLDHVQHNGGNEAANLVTACFDCNISKSWRSLKTFLKEFPDSKVEHILRRIERALAKPIDVAEAKKVIAARRESPF